MSERSNRVELWCTDCDEQFKTKHEYNYHECEDDNSFALYDHYAKKQILERESSKMKKHNYRIIKREQLGLRTYVVQAETDNGWKDQRSFSDEAEARGALNGLKDELAGKNDIVEREVATEEVIHEESI
jgi:hypothetical protein